ncbi:MAG: glycosyltransferase family 2 protein [Bacillota bacterium]
MKKEKISGCLIVKDEAEALERCIKSMLPVLDELIIVDTGSMDNTVEIAKRYTDKVYNYAWQNDFAAARNFAISKAKKDWIIFLDADEYFSERSLKNIRKAINEENGKADAFLINGYNILSSSGEVKDKFTVIRVFRNSPEIRYQGRIHEYLRKKGRFTIVDCTDIIEIFHTGYNQAVADQKNKNERNLSLLLQDIAERPDDGNTHFYLSLQYLAMEEHEKVLYHSRKSLDYGITILGREASAYVNYIKISLELGRDDIDKLINMCYECIHKHPRFPDGYLLLVDCLLQKGDLDGAVKQLEDFLDSNFKEDLKYVSNINIGVYQNIYKKLGDIYNYEKKDLYKAVYYYARFLKQDIYNEVAFKKLMMILVNHENQQSIINFLGQIYKDNTVRDLYYLAIQFAKLDSYNLKEYYKEKLAALD